VTIVYRLKNVVKERLIDGVGFRLVVPDIQISAKENIALIGHSGCGKSTLLDILALISKPDSLDQISLHPVDGESHDIANLWEHDKQSALSQIRKQHIGYVLQSGGLLPYLTVSRVLGIDRQLDKLPGLLSAGERQRASFARALSHRPSILIADEPTAALDPITAQKIMAVVMEVIRGLNITLITASHDWAGVYKMELRTLKQESEVLDDGKVYQSRFSD
jgi:putative ABC transport system ATP-binding protein